MKPEYLLILLLQFGSPLQAQVQEKVMSCHLKNVPFEEFCEAVSLQTGVNIFYTDKWVNNLKVTLDSDNISVLSAIQMVIEGSGLGVSVWNNDLVILPGVKLLSELPAYEHIANTKGPTEKKDKQITESEERYITGRKPGAIQTITIGRAGTNIGNSRVKVLGKNTG